MSGNTLTTSSSVSYSFTSDSSPLTIAQTGTISASILTGAVYAASTIASPSLNNLGVVINSYTAPTSSGVKFLDGGYIYNSGTIDGHLGVYIGSSSGTVVNHGSIIANTGSGIGVAQNIDSGIGIELLAGGIASNFGTITGYKGIYISGGSGTVVNDGSIATSTTSGIGIELLDGTASNSNSGTITGRVGVSIGGVGTVINDGNILADTTISTPIAPHPVGVSIGGVGTVINDGNIIAGTSISPPTAQDPGIVLASGYVRNEASAHITAFVGAAIEVTGSDVTANSSGFLIGANGTVINAGIITAGVYQTQLYGNGIYLHAGGYVLNAANATIVAIGGRTVSASAGKGIYISPPQSNTGEKTGTLGDATVVNDGTIEASEGWGVDIGNGGYVTNAAHGFIYGERFGVYFDNPGTLVNAGTISSNYANWGVALNVGGTVTNEAGGFIYGGYHGVGAEKLQVATVINDGIILGGHIQTDGGGSVGGNGIALLDDGYVSNGAHAMIYGYRQGVYMQTDRGGTGTLVNAGDIEAHGDAVLITSPGLVTNVATGTIAGSAAGIVIDGNGTVVNAGTIGFAGTVLPETPPAAPSLIFSEETASSTSPIATTSRPAIDLAGSGANRLIVDPGAVFIGLVEANTAARNAMELASGSSAGTLTGIGSQFTGFGTIQIDTGASWTLAGSMAGFNGDSISGFSGSDTIDVTGFTAATGTIELGSSDVLTVGSLALTFTGAETGELFAITSDNSGGTDITLDTLCYLRGTRILTPTGALPVEDIAIGDLLVTRFAGMAKVKWIGRQSFDLRFVQDNRDRLPVRIRAGALGEKLPARDLYVSPGHSMLLENTLVLARNLVNGVSITQETGPENNPAIIDYFQIELDSHDCVIAEGTWSETYADGPGMRDQYQNAAEFYALYPDQPPPQQLELCAPRPEHGAKLDAALRPVVARASEGILPGALEGYIDFADTWRIEGWALDQDHPELPVLLEIWVEDRLLGTVLACDHRGDLLDAGKSNGNCAFIYHLPMRQPEGELRIVRAADGAALRVSDHCQTKAEATTPVSKSVALSLVA
jgi:hypothetical protein